MKWKIKVSLSASSLSNSCNASPSNQKLLESSEKIPGSSSSGFNFVVFHCVCRSLIYKFVLSIKILIL